MKAGIFIAPVALIAFAALAVPTIAPAAGAAVASPDNGADAGTENWLAINTLTATATRDGRTIGMLQIEAGLEIRDPALHARAAALRPRLRDAYQIALADYIARLHRPGGAPDAARIGDMLQQATDRTLGQPGADFLLGMVILH